MLKVCTWNIGCFFFLKYAKYFGIKFNNNKILHEYFQPKINGLFVSNYIEKSNADIVFLQEFFYPEDIKSIKILEKYPYKKLINAWYHEHSILVASNKDFEITKINNFYLVYCEGFNFIPVHLNSFSAQKRFEDILVLKEIAKNYTNLFILGDTNIWSRGQKFVFSYDKKTYKILTEILSDFSKKIISTTYIGLGLDKVFGSKDIYIPKIESPKVRNHFMDHYPIIFEIKL